MEPCALLNELDLAQFEPTVRRPSWSSPARSLSSSPPRPPALSPPASRARTCQQVDMASVFISPNELQIGEKIGSGASGVVRSGVWRGTAVAVKQLFLAESSWEAEWREELAVLRHEAAVFASLRHPNIALFLGACFDRPSCFIVTQLYSRGSLQDLLTDPDQQIELARKRELALDVARGLNYLHTFQPPIIHRDIKSSNVLIDDSYRARITDFGITCHWKGNGANSPRLTSGVGTLRWTAPELLGKGAEHRSYTPAVDVYSFGVLLWELAMRKLPYFHVKFNLEVEAAVLEGKRPTSYPGCQPQGKLFWHPFGTPLCCLMEDCWRAKPADRPAMEAAVERLSRIAVEQPDQLPPTPPSARPSDIARADSGWRPPPPPPRAVMGTSPRSMTAQLEHGQASRVSVLEAQLEEKSAQIDRLTSLCRSANRDAAEAHAEIIRLKRKLRQSKSCQSSARHVKIL